MANTASPTFQVLILAHKATTIRTIRHYLRHHDACVHAVSNGVDAILSANLQRYDLVLCDCDIADPILVDALACIRADARHADLAILGMSARLSGVGASFAAARISGWLALPLDELDFLATVGRWRPAPARAGPPPAHDVGQGEAALAVAPALARLRGNAGLYRTMLRRFVDTHGATAAVLRQAALAADLALAARTAHDLRALAGTIGATALSDSLVLLEQAIASPQHGAFTVALALTEQQFRATLADVLAYLEATPP